MRTLYAQIIGTLLLMAAAPADAGSGWLLLHPPTTGTLDSDSFIFDDSAPLSLWKRPSDSPYVTERLCQMERINRMARFEELMGMEIKAEIERAVPGAGEKIRQDMARAFKWTRAAQCVSSDDPRLAAASSPAPPSVKRPPLGFREGLEALDQEKRSLPNDGGVIHYTPGRPIVVTVRLNGRSSARLVLDTGADRSMIRSRSLIAAGVDLARPVARGKIRGVAGETEVSYFNVDSMEIGGARVRSLRVAAYDMGESASDGLLGRDFLDGFNVSIDPAAGIIRLTPR